MGKKTKKVGAVALNAFTNINGTSQMKKSINESISTAKYSKFAPELHDYGRMVNLSYNFAEEGSNSFSRRLAIEEFDSLKINQFLKVRRDLSSPEACVVKNTMTNEIIVCFHGAEGGKGGKDWETIKNVMKGRSNSDPQIMDSERVLSNIVVNLHEGETVTLVGYSLGGDKVHYLSTLMGSSVDKVVYMNPFLSPLNTKRGLVPEHIKNEMYRISDDPYTLQAEFVKLNNNTTYTHIPPLNTNTSFDAPHFIDQFTTADGVRQSKEQMIINVEEAELINTKTAQVQNAIEMKGYENFGDWYENKYPHKVSVNSAGDKYIYDGVKRSDVQIWEEVSNQKLDLSTFEIKNGVYDSLAHKKGVFKSIATASESEAQNILSHFSAGEISMEAERGLPYLQKMAMTSGLQVAEHIEYLGQLLQATILAYHLGNDYDNHASALTYTKTINNDLNPYATRESRMMMMPEIEIYFEVIDKAYKFTYNKIKNYYLPKKATKPLEYTNDSGFVSNRGQEQIDWDNRMKQQHIHQDTATTTYYTKDELKTADPFLYDTLYSNFDQYN